MQENIIITFKQLFLGRTLREMADATGIQVTRLFRLLNGAEMKLSEYQKFKQVIQNIQGGKGSTIELGDEIFSLTEIYLKKLSMESVAELGQFLKYKIRIKEAISGNALASAR